MLNAKEIQNELVRINRAIFDLRKQKNSLKRNLKKMNQPITGENAYYNLPIWLYVLELEDGCYYVGITRNVDKRFKRHTDGKGAMWTKLHKPIRIIYKKQTDIIIESEATKLEDNLTLEIAGKYGYDVTRGGQWCSPFKGFPSHIAKSGLWKVVKSN